ncbi:hypothetical protein BGZ65_007432 [Modicella reniformis]|uniref:Uncharacterized protein n=1 Tax=Modicella reniformis TaxID=1440133 RepID=A0A9P6SQW2_9FUNG|nr:hypothetical protein BGZ65_007432 [Modicella reniformis]
MTIPSNEQPIQPFRNRSTGRVANIPTVSDPKTEGRSILWSDIKTGFKNAESIWNGECLVPLLRDENLEQITPLRIAYHPEIVLEAVEADAQVDSTRAAASSTAISPVVALAAAYINTLVVCSTGVVPEESQSSPYTPNQLHSPCTQAIMLNQEAQTTILKNLMEERLSLILQKQDQTNERLAIIQSHLEALLTQTYELHEYPIPRLFIVLPKVARRRDRLTNLFSEPYRLYFLCECGTHTMAEHSKTPPGIHLAKHEGYDLDRPKEFFEKYGSYVLALMYMVKLGIIAAGLIVPPLASLKILDGLDSTKEAVKYLRRNIGFLVDDTIQTLKNFKSIGETSTELVTDYTDLDRLEALEGADLRQFDSYLKVKDEKRVLGNLYRIVTTEGHVKWVRLDHYRAKYRELVVQQLREVVKINEGKFIEETGRIEIKIGSNNLARRFYDSMAKTRGILELDITLEWDATMEDFRALANAVIKANVIGLTVDGTHFKSPAFDVMNRGRRFDPLLQLASYTPIQFLQLQGFDNFFSRITNSARSPSPKLRVFSVQSGAPFKDVAKFFNNDVEHFSGLTTLELNLHHPHSISGLAPEIRQQIQQAQMVED